MPVVTADGITTRYEAVGAGPALLMFSPGGFDSSLDNWRSFGRYAQLRLLDRLSQQFTCITFDRRESGQSGGRIERLSWDKYVAQAIALLDALGIDTVHLMGGCVGCSTAAALAIARPDRVASMVLFSPAGGVHYRRMQQSRFAQHLAFVRENGLDAVIKLARDCGAGFSADPRVGPWGTSLRRHGDLVVEVAGFDPDRYALIVEASGRLLFDRDTVPGLDAEDLLLLDVPALIVPGQDRSHAPSAARYLQECLPTTEYWDIPVAEQNAVNTSARVLRFLSAT